MAPTPCPLSRLLSRLRCPVSRFVSRLIERGRAVPSSPPKPCTVCGTLVRDGGSRCEQHRQSWVKNKPTKRVTGRRLQAMREALFMRDPLCAECTRLGRVSLATQRDHIVPLAEGGADDHTNEQGLCDDCHREKSLSEALTGRRRAGGGG